MREAGVATGPVLVSEARFLAVPIGHPLARPDTAHDHVTAHR